MQSMQPLIEGHTEAELIEIAQRIGSYDCIASGGRQLRTWTGARTPEALANTARALLESAARYDAATAAALGNRTPARQEERPNGNESAAPLPVQGQDTAVLLHGDAFLPDVRQALGEVLTEGLLDMAESPDWNDSREVDRVIDMVQNVLARQVEKANEGERDIAALRASSAPTTKG